MTPYPRQVELARRGLILLREHMMVYLACEERTGKTLAAILMAEDLDIKSVLVLTKKNALKGWNETLSAYPHKKYYTVTNYHQAKNMDRHDLLILDESHNYISGFPKASAMHGAISRISKRVPIIYISATPHAQGYSMLYHQFSLSSWSPWRTYSTFYSWFNTYGIPHSQWFHGREVPVYTKTKEDLVIAGCEHLFITATRKQLGFTHEPKDKLHYINLKQGTMDVYNELMKEKYLLVDGYELIADTSMRLRAALHMLEGGALKIDEQFIVMPNTEKIDFIKKTWGDNEQLVIYYYYIAEGIKLRKHFKKAMILQATSYAEGIDLAHVDNLVIYSQDWSTARHTQRRARQAGSHRDKPITVHFLLVQKAISDQVYNTVSINKTNFVDSVFEREYI